MEILSAVFAGTIAAALFILAGIRKIRNIRAGKRGKAARGACRGTAIHSTAFTYHRKD